ncbi:hypothetical protein [Sphingomonas bacterium]|uniref:hypothetical protein n=1 Tax=Sphingomonas bacterium TaxID=1895847 RepID=UPI001574FA1D|nr:hypothetical protein [Sphingomonas bacterium]
MTDTTISDANMADPPAEPKTAESSVEPKATDTPSEPKTASASVTDGFKDNATKYGAQAADKAREFADTGKQRATGALDQLSQMLHDAAGQIDERLGAQYGEYARTAAGQVSGFAEQLKAKDVDVLVDDARHYVRKSPAVAIGVAAALGFVVARLVQSGVDASGTAD